HIGHWRRLGDRGRLHRQAHSKAHAALQVLQVWSLRCTGTSHQPHCRGMAQWQDKILLSVLPPQVAPVAFAARARVLWCTWFVRAGLWMSGHRGAGCASSNRHVGCLGLCLTARSRRTASPPLNSSVIAQESSQWTRRESFLASPRRLYSVS